MNRLISEAVGALGELKRRVEAEAAQTSYKLVLERDRLRQEVADLRREQARLQQEIQESRRQEAEKEVGAAAPAKLTSLGDLPTPRIQGGSPVVVPPEPARLASDEDFRLLAELQEFLMGGELDLPLTASPEAPVSEASVSPEPPPSPVISEPESTPAAPLPHFRPAELEKTLAQPHTRTFQPVSHLLNKRWAALAASGSPPGPTPVEPERDMAPAVTPASAQAPALAGLTGRAARKRPAHSLSEAERVQKGGLHELGLQLGLDDPMTPPSINLMHFANGYTPPRGVLPLVEFLGEIKANASAITPPPGAVAVEAPAPEKPAKKVVEPPPPIPLDHDLEEYSIDQEPVNPTLEELLEAGEQELAAINEDPTPPENPTPFIGKLGPEHPVHFPTSTVTPKPEALAMLNQAAALETGITQSFKVISDRPGPVGSSPTPTRSFRPGRVVRPIKPPAAPVSPESTGAETLAQPSPPQADLENPRKTQVTISNLHGRYSLLMLEKTLRDLVGVAQVIVTNFSKGVLIMEVSHRPDFDLLAHLLSSNELHLKLIQEGPGTLAFVQENSGGGNS
jgi:hypothetical protein